jgi:hypothetical protein
MLSRVLLIACALSLPLAQSALSQQQPPGQPPQQRLVGPPQKESHAPDEQTKPEQRGSEQAPFIVKILGAEDADNKFNTNSANGIDQPWSLSDRIAAIAIIVGFLQFIALILTVGVMRGTGRRQLRAYVLPEGGALTEGTMLTPTMPAHAGEPGIAMQFKNSGQTPAYRFVNWMAIAVIDPANAHTLIPPSSLPLQSPATIGAGGTLSKALWFGRILTASEIADVQAAAKYIFVYGRIEYRDAFRRKRWCTYRLQYAGQFPPAPGILFTFSDAGNDSN